MLTGVYDIVSVSSSVPRETKGAGPGSCGRHAENRGVTVHHREKGGISTDHTMERPWRTFILQARGLMPSEDAHSSVAQ